MVGLHPLMVASFYSHLRDVRLKSDGVTEVMYVARFARGHALVVRDERDTAMKYIVMKHVAFEYE